MTTTEHSSEDRSEHSSDHGRPPAQSTPDHTEVAHANHEQYAAWNGEEGDLWAAHPTFFDNSVRHLHRHLMEAAALAPDDRVLDVGCGNGQCTHDAARAASRGSALGIDLSLPMLGVAKSVAQRDGLGNATFVHGDAQVYPFPRAAFDVAVSRTSAMFFADQVAALSNIAHALRAGGRLAVVSWRGPTENEWFSSLARALLGAPPPPPPPSVPSPFRHADASATTDILHAAGFGAVELRPLDTPMYFGRDAGDGFLILRDLLGWMVRDREPVARRQALERLRSILVEHETDDGVAFGCAAWLITARRS
jgi:SAM-dependent methyltransferase